MLGAATVIAFALVAWMAPQFLAVAAVVLLLGDLGSQIRRFFGHEDSIVSLRFSPDGADGFGGSRSHAPSLPSLYVSVKS